MLSDKDLLATLVSFDTTSANSNVALADFICDYVDGAGVRIVRNPSVDGAKTNLVAAVGPDDGTRRGLVLSGHMDTVPAREDGWETDPFTLTETDGRLTARGACDMKGFLALAMNVFVRARDRGVRHALVLLFTYDEELGTLGSKRFVETWADDPPLPGRAIIGEPTSLVPVRRHKGHLKLRVTTAGTSAHSGLPHLGRNAIEPAGRIITGLTALRRELEAEQSGHRDAFPQVPFLALNVAMVSGGSAINVVPDRCAIDVGIRTLPGTDLDGLVARVRDVCAVHADDYDLEVVGDSPPMELDGDSPFCQSLVRHAGASSGAGADFATDAGWLQRLDMECVLLGPGAMEVAHKPNEWLAVEQLHRGTATIAAIVTEQCGGGAP